MLRSKYVFGYQGAFAEEDPETGYSAFDLRLYDKRLGRWLTPDPYGQYFSSYLGMGNNPVNFVDPDGGWVKGAGFFENIFRSDYNIHQKATEKANLVPTSIWSEGFTEEGVSKFMVVDKSVGQVLNENPGLFRNLMNRYDGTDFGQSLFLSNMMYSVQNSGVTKLMEAVMLTAITLPFGGVGGAVGRTGQALNATSKVPQLGNKLSYLLGNATGRLHNLQRSTTMARQLNSIGIYNNSAGQALLRSNLGATLNNSKSILQYTAQGTIRESLLMGPHGGLKMTTYWRGSRLTTAVLKGGL